jgi:type II secretory pathway component HofQ
MKSPTSSHHVLKSLAELSPELLGAKARAPEKPQPQQTHALMQEAKQQTIQPSFPTASEMRGYRGWGINE